jgi:hypothetical protein
LRLICNQASIFFHKMYLQKIFLLVETKTRQKCQFFFYLRNYLLFKNIQNPYPLLFLGIKKLQNFSPCQPKRLIQRKTLSKNFRRLSLLVWDKGARLSLKVLEMNSRGSLLRSRCFFFFTPSLDGT